MNIVYCWALIIGMQFAALIYGPNVVEGGIGALFFILGLFVAYLGRYEK